MSRVYAVALINLPAAVGLGVLIPEQPLSVFITVATSIWVAAMVFLLTEDKS